MLSSSDDPSNTSRKRKLDTKPSDNKTEIGCKEEIPLRDCSKLYCSPITLRCAQLDKCVPCGYKIGNFDVSMDVQFKRQVPNQRPEQCPRASSAVCPEGTLGFRQSMNVLTIGDGDMSFSLALARLMKPRISPKKTLLIATSYEKKSTLLQCYPNFAKNLQELENLGAKLCYEVDATRIQETLSLPQKHNFHRIIWNFPCTAIENGQDGQNDAMEHNKDLVRNFVACASNLLMASGEIHICHKTKPPYNQWRLEHVALDKLPQNVIHYMGRVVLDRFLLPPYTPRKALDRKSFPCHDACFYIFGIRSSTKEDSKKILPTIGKDSKGAGDPPTISITPDIILSIRNSLLQNAKSKRPKHHSDKRKRKKEF